MATQMQSLQTRHAPRDLHRRLVAHCCTTLPVQLNQLLYTLVVPQYADWPSHGKKCTGTDTTDGRGSNRCRLTTVPPTHLRTPPGLRVRPDQVFPSGRGPNVGPRLMRTAILLGIHLNPSDFRSKPSQAQLVLRWVTTWEHWVLHAFAFFP